MWTYKLVLISKLPQYKQRLRKMFIILHFILTSTSVYETQIPTKIHTTFLTFFRAIFIFYLFYLYIYPPDSQESDGGANT